MKLTVVGCSPAWPNPGGAQSGYLVEAEGTRVLLDCGPGVLARLLERERWPHVHAIVITHFHLDHFGDLVPWALGVRYGTGAEAEPPALWVPPGERGVLFEHAERLASAELFEQAFDVREYRERDSFRVGGIAITPRLVPHYAIRAYALRVEAGGRVLAYSADCGPNEALVETARDADVLLCEATLAEPEPEPRGHLTAAEAVAAAERAGAKRLLLVHHPFDRPAEPGTELAHDGFELEL